MTGLPPGDYFAVPLGDGEVADRTVTIEGRLYSVEPVTALALETARIKRLVHSIRAQLNELEKQLDDLAGTPGAGPAPLSEEDRRFIREQAEQIAREAKAGLSGPTPFTTPPDGA